MRHMWIAALFAGLIITVGCAQPKLTPAGQKVRVVTDESVLQNCEKIVIVVVSAQSTSKKKEAELRLIIALNRAAENGGNAIIPVGELVSNDVDKQEYGVYVCE